MLITFSGLDGAGKSTLIEWLRRELAREARAVTVLHQNDHIGLYAGLRALRDLVLRRERIERPPRMDPSATLAGRLRDAVIWSRTLRRLLYPVDLLVFLCCRGYVEKVRGRILIMDRYFYDTLVDVAGDRDTAWTRFLTRVTPTPDLAVLLQISPEEAFARKGEYTVPYLRRRDEAYHRLFPRLPSAVRLPAHELDAAKTQLRRVVRDRLLR